MTIDYDEYVQRVREILDAEMSVTQKAATIGMISNRCHATWLRTRLAPRLSQVVTGPFKGMKNHPEAVEIAGPLSPLRDYYSGYETGLHESELHWVIERIIATGYHNVINIGCAEGYYAVGLARRMPEARVIGYDLDGDLIARARRLAALNDVADRVTLHQYDFRQDADTLDTDRTVILTDIEGAEDEVLDPVRWPGLAACDHLVEVHEVYRPGLTRRLAARFATSHELRLIHNDSAPAPPTDDFPGLGLLQRAILAQQYRGATPWLFMTRRT